MTWPFGPDLPLDLPKIDRPPVRSTKPQTRTVEVNLGALADELAAAPNGTLWYSAYRRSTGEWRNSDGDETPATFMACHCRSARRMISLHRNGPV
jgi:hypothetical protein